MTVSVAVIGAGAFGVEHLRAYAEMDDVRIVGVADANPDRAETIAREFHTVAIAPGAVVADAVSLVVPAHVRGGLALDLIDSGAAVFIEKPLASTAAAADILVSAAQGRVVMVGHVLRFAEPYRQLAADARDLGPLRGGSLSRRRSASHAEQYPAEDVIGLTMIHDLDAVTWLSDARPVSVSAVGTRGADGRWVRCRADVVVSDGTSWTVEAEWVGGPQEHEDRARIEGRDGAASLVLAGAEADAAYRDALTAELRHFVDHVAAGTASPVLTMRDAALAVRLADAVRASLEREGVESELTHES